MNLIVALIINAIAVLVSAYLVPGVTVQSFVTALVVAIVLGFLNAFVRPILLFLTLPINILTLGLFTIVINLLMLVITDSLIDGFAMDGLLATIIFAIVLSVVSSGLAMLFGRAHTK